MGVVGGAGLLVLMAGAWGYFSYAGRRALLDGEIARYRVDLEKKSNDLGEQSKLKKRLAELSVGALGENEETVSASIRTALNEIAADCGLGSTSVTTRESEAVKNPAVKAGAVEFKGRLKELNDFYTMAASVTGSGTLEQVMKALVTIQAQPWTRRVDAVSFRPVGSAKDRARIEMTVRLTTAFFPGVKPAKALETAWMRADPERLASIQPILAKNAFREKAAPAVAAAPPPVAAPVVGAPYADWRVTAVVRGLAGPELWLTNEKTRQSLTLAVGQAVIDAVFLGAAGEVARLKIGEQEFEVALAQTLQDRKVITR
jgi:hypothetical protein